jgi:hypothetical protein
MAQRRFHYEQAFEHYLRANRTPYIAVDEARKSLLPARAGEVADVTPLPGGLAVKSFDFVVYAPGRNLLVDVKGRMYGPAGGQSSKGSMSRRRFETWVTMDDVTGLRTWQELFGPGFEATFVFAYCLRRQPPDALFEEVFAFGGRWYALREIPLAAYAREMTPRSGRWQTVHLAAEAAARISRPFSVRPGALPERYCPAAAAALS